jgi:hypothetical protein
MFCWFMPCAICEPQSLKPRLPDHPVAVPQLDLRPSTTAALQGMARTAQPVGQTVVGSTMVLLLLLLAQFVNVET